LDGCHSVGYEFVTTRGLQEEPQHVTQSDPPPTHKHGYWKQSPNPDSRSRNWREDETFYVVSGTAEVWIDREIFRCEAGDRVFGPRNVFHTYRNVGDTDLKMILIYTPGGFEQSFLDREAMLEAGKDQSEVGRMLAERYGVTRGQLPT
jgi:mannose-6-phosphate isomerase-like protein (cupin superfamily)